MDTTTTWREWVIDATMGDHWPPCMVPVEDGTLVIGMNLIGGVPPPMGKLIGLFHESQEAADDYIVRHREQLRALFPEGMELFLATPDQPRDAREGAEGGV